MKGWGYNFTDVSSGLDDRITVLISPIEILEHICTFNKMTFFLNIISGSDNTCNNNVDVLK